MSSAQRPYGRPNQANGFRPRHSAPPDVWVAAIAMGILGVLLLLPFLIGIWPSLGGLGSADKLTRAFAALLSMALIIFGAAGGAIIALAVALVRGSRVAQILACLLCAAITVGEVASLAEGVYMAGQYAVVMVIVMVACIAVIALLLGAPRSREFFALDSDRPLGVGLSMAIGAYYGVSVTVVGLLLMLAGAASVKYVWLGVLLVIGGGLLLSTLRSLAAGSAWARNTMSVAFVACTVLQFIIANGSVSFGTLLALGLGAGGLLGLWLPDSSRAHFSMPRPVAPASSLVVAGWAAFSVAGIAAVAVGFSSLPGAGGLASADSPASSSAAAPGIYADSSQAESSAAQSSAVQSSAAQSSAAQSSAEESAAASSAAGAQVEAGPMTHTWTATYSAPGGYAFTAALAAGDPMQGVPGLDNNGFLLGNACDDINPQTDAVVPAVVTVTSTTPSGFTVHPAFHIALGYDNAEAVVSFSDSGPTCEDSDFGAEWDDGLAAGQQGAAQMFFVIHDYYTPDHPHGDPSVLASATISFTDSSSNEMQFSLQNTSGPGVQDDGSFSLDGQG